LSGVAVLFVRLGNIGRSPLAAAASRAEVQRVGLAVEIDAAGTGGWHKGHPPDRPALAPAHRLGVNISGLRAPAVTAEGLEGRAVADP
jgi:protein-tyrosine phosphatase